MLLFDNWATFLVAANAIAQHQFIDSKHISSKSIIHSITAILPRHTEHLSPPSHYTF